MKFAFVLSVLFLVISCTKNSESGLVGLWQVEKVSIGNMEMTPVGKWSRFNADFTQESGNGWYQHSIGKWKTNDDFTELTVTNENGLKDNYGPFEVEILENEMSWKRMEEGENVQVTLRRITKIPMSNRDEILGLWELEPASDDKSELDEELETEKYLFFKWDRKFVKGLDKGRVFGVYSIHGHKPEIELIPYGDEVKREFWEFSIENNLLKMSLLNADKEIVKLYKRTAEFPD